MDESIRRSGARSPARTGALLGLGLVALLAPAAARADRISLRGGGQIRGKLIPDPADPGRLLLLTETAKHPIAYRKEQILQVEPEASILDEYAALRARDRPLAEEEFQLGAWAEEHGLKEIAASHYEAAIRRDPDYAPAREKLGHALVDGRWLDADAQREAQGMVKYRGKWITAEEKARIDDQSALAAENQSWARRVKSLRDAYVAGPAARSRDAECRLVAIREVAAVGPVFRTLGGDPDPAVRELAGRSLASIPGAEAASALVARLLDEADGSVRQALIPQLRRREAEHVVPRLVRALRSPQPTVINRAAWALGQLDARAAVPKLIPALVSTEYRTEMVPIGGGAGVAGANAAAVAPAAGPSFSNYTGSTYLGLTPPVVGPGVVAFGATGVPIGSGVALGGGGVGVAGGGVGLGSGGGVSYAQRTVPIAHPNVEVLAALVRLTGKDFQYDAGAWNRWAAASFRSDPTPGRRVNQP